MRDVTLLQACRLVACLLLLPGSVVANAAENCFQYGSGGWDLIYWGENPRLPPTPDRSIPICGGVGAVVFRWRHPQGVFLIPSAQCPGGFTAPANDTYKEVAAVSSSNEAGFVWIPPSEPASYWLTSPVPGACESGVKVRVDVISPTSSPSSGAAAAAWGQRGQLLMVAAAALASAALVMGD
ncbi:hypothetical protein D9Q98_008426 [Chlorella vulgaris]|uniref:Uncharacterized protein n=1 Tax=Chlorella vulgaris TaxID=3077 RepID=A0A9D4YT81_CHLVU|nr:hypothetical protein D9Q98_008426 [Chlorella vulgaris]